MDVGLTTPVMSYENHHGGQVQRIDVMVFRYPPKPNVITSTFGGLPDTVSYLNKKLSINGRDENPRWKTIWAKESDAAGTDASFWSGDLFISSSSANSLAPAHLIWMMILNVLRIFRGGEFPFPGKLSLQRAR